MSKKTYQITSTCELNSDFTSGGFITKLSITHKSTSGIATKEILFLNLHEVKDLKDFLETLL